MIVIMKSVSLMLSILTMLPAVLKSGALFFDDFKGFSIFDQAQDRLSPFAFE